MVQPLQPLRPLSNTHVIRLKKAMMDESVGKYGVLLCNIPGVKASTVSKDDLIKGGRYSMEVLGGNHRREALQQLCHSAETKDTERFHTWPVKVYAGLNDLQKSKLATEHNMEDKRENKLDMSFEDHVRLIRRELFRAFQVEEEAQTPVLDDHNSSEMQEFRQGLLQIYTKKVRFFCLFNFGNG